MDMCESTSAQKTGRGRGRLIITCLISVTMMDMCEFTSAQKSQGGGGGGRLCAVLDVSSEENRQFFQVVDGLSGQLYCPKSLIGNT